MRATTIIDAARGDRPSLVQNEGGKPVQKFLAALVVTMGLSACDSGIVATNRTNLLNEAMGDVVERSEGAAITVDGQTYLVTRVERTFTDDDSYSQYYGQRRTIYYDEINVRGVPVDCFRVQDCAQQVREEIARQSDRRIPVDDGDQM
tara:strand:- start:712 stop:1155 length:444 start_codon:yes stop_codon:yes gene_type:complete